MIKIVLLLDFSEEYHKNLLKGIIRFSREYGPWIFLRMPVYYRETIGIDGILKWATEWGAQGLIGQLHNNSEIWKFKNAGISVIAQDFEERFRDVPNITGAYHETGKKGAGYFLKKGFKNFAFYGFKNIVWSRERAEGYEEAIKEAGYSVHYFEHEKTQAMDLWYYKPSVLSKWLISLPKPIALMTCDDNQGLHITEASRLAGIRIPEDVAVLGVDNDENVCFLSDPPLSSVTLGVEKGGYEAARLMQQMIAGTETTSDDIIVKPTQIITRASTDIYATNDELIVNALKFIHLNVDKKLKVDQLLKEVPLSRRSLEKRFIQTTGYPIYKYIYTLRIERFMKKLLETEMTITEIADELGFEDTKTLSRLFKQMKGLTPVEYRKRFSVKK